MTDPIKHIAQPNFPNVPSFSFKKYDPSTAPIKTLSAPRGVTKIAGANAYAAKFAISPTITVHIPLANFPALYAIHPYMLLCHPTILDSSDM
jgi:hypothetical protein